MRTLEEAAREASTCTKCGLAETRTQVVYGVGSPTADLLFIGEGPGFHEDKQGEPFVGAAGQLLNRMLDGIGLERADVYIANVVKCRPPGNRDPRPAEIEACTPYLREQIDLIDPRVVVTLGNWATRFILDKPELSISRVRGGKFPWNGRIVIPTFHPAAILHGGGENSRQFQALQQDFEIVKRTLAETLQSAVDPRARPTSDGAADRHTSRSTEAAADRHASRSTTTAAAGGSDEDQLELF